jgi:DNA helicase-2/ATP-dependent DNA helicase PcrA
VGTDIAKFGNDVLAGTFRSDEYSGISLVTYAANKNQAFFTLKTQVMQARKRMLNRGVEDWTVAVLVPTKKMARLVSDYLRSQQSKLPPIEHHASIDVEAVILAAEVIAYLLQPKAGKGDFRNFVRLVCNFFEGRGGDTPSKADMQESANIEAAFEKAAEALQNNKKINKNSLILPMLRTYRAARSVELTGGVDEDWIAIRAMLQNGQCNRLKKVALESKNLRLLNRGTQLRLTLSQAWRDSTSYMDALEIVRRSFVQEHFARAWKPETGVVVMNMHKAKGKQFDEVVIFEGWPRISGGKIVSNSDRIVRGNDSNQDLGQSRQNFRVSITRAKLKATIMNPEIDPCCLLIGLLTK